MAGFVSKMVQDDFQEEKILLGSSELLTLVNSVQATKDGKKLIIADPNISDDTLKQLFETDGALIKDENEREFLQKASPIEIFRRYFIQDNQIGMAHVSMIISHNPSQSLIEVISEYSDDCNLCFLEGAARIKGYINTRTLVRYQKTKEWYVATGWKPKSVFLPRTGDTLPKTKIKSKRHLTYVASNALYELENCPICGAKAELLRCGAGSVLWKVCCTDPNRLCDNFYGIEAAKKTRDAALLWNNYVKRVRQREAAQLNDFIQNRDARKSHKRVGRSKKQREEDEDERIAKTEDHPFCVK